MKVTINENIIDFIDSILTYAIKQNASDIHFEPYHNVYRIRMRVDGILRTISEPKMRLASAITTRLKILADLDIAERRLPQDGHFRFITQDKITRDCRISTFPILHGEKIVVRILNPEQELLPLDSLGLLPQQLTQIKKTLRQPHGMILVTGPTGSGKTVTLYSMLKTLNKETRNLLSLEDPVEIELPGVNQTNVKPKIGLDFAASLRCLLRQDPDIIMVGEIRDFETATMAIRAAQTGHLVLATLHTNTAAASIVRLLNIGIAHYNITSAVRLVIAQRLLRRLCPHCLQQKNCSHCHDGFYGRIGIFEMMSMSSTLATSIKQHCDDQTLNNKAVQEGMLDMQTAAQSHLSQNLTTQAEINRVLSA